MRAAGSGQHPAGPATEARAGAFRERAGPVGHQHPSRFCRHPSFTDATGLKGDLVAGRRSPARRCGGCGPSPPPVHEPCSPSGHMFLHPETEGLLPPAPEATPIAAQETRPPTPVTGKDSSRMGKNPIKKKYKRPQRSVGLRRRLPHGVGGRCTHERCTHERCTHARTPDPRVGSTERGRLLRMRSLPRRLTWNQPCVCKCHQHCDASGGVGVGGAEPLSLRTRHLQKPWGTSK